MNVLETVELSLDITRLATLVGGLSAGGERTTILAQMRQQVDTLRMAAKDYSDSLEKSYDKLRASFQKYFDILGKLDVEVDGEKIARADHLISEAADNIRQMDAAAREKLYPRIEELRQNSNRLGGRDLAEARGLAEEGISIAEACLERKDAFKKKVSLLLKRRTVPAKALRARAVEGEIDHAALSREFIARYPKIRAALAE